MLAVFFLSFAMAQVISAQHVTPHSSPLSLNDQQSLERRCQNLSSFAGQQREVCNEAVKTWSLHPSSVQFCTKFSKSDLVPCLRASKDRLFDPSILNLCQKINRTVGKSIPPVAECLTYFAETQSTFDIKGAQLCFSQSSGAFHEAVNCLNVIRDRTLDLQEIETKCKTRTVGLGPGPYDLVCIERLINKAELLPRSECSNSQTPIIPKPAPTGAR